MIVSKICCYFVLVVTNICYSEVIKCLILEINFVVVYNMLEIECVNVLLFKETKKGRVRNM